MDSVLECLPRGSRVAILRLRSLGDCVLTTPALDLLKGYRPDLRVAIVVEERFRAIFEDHASIDEILPPELGPLRAFRPHLCLNLHGGTRSAWMTLASGARFRAGFGHFRQRMIYNVRIPRAQEIFGCDRVVHTAEHLASAMFYLGVPLCDVPQASLGVVGQALSPAQCLVHPFGATPEKTWRAEGFLTVAEYLCRSGQSPVFIGGPGDDLSPFRAYRTISSAPLAEIKRLLAGASLFIGNDSGPAHMAAAFGVPVVVIFGASNPAIWGPWRTVSEIVTAPEGIANVSTTQVLDALQRLKVPA